jgi:predicted dehydrogenase
MIHDLDVILSLVPSAIASIDSVGVHALTDKVDIANARLRFDNGCVANVTASRISTERVRKLRIFESDSYLSIDYARQEGVLTLEGLSVSYFLRASRMYDSLMQMGRWFGYRPGYMDACRLFITAELQEWYQYVACATLELRRD